MRQVPQYKVVQREEVLRVEFAEPVEFETAALYSGRKGTYATTEAVFRYVGDDEPLWEVSAYRINKDGTLMRTATGFASRFYRDSNAFRTFVDLAAELDPRDKEN